MRPTRRGFLLLLSPALTAALVGVGQAGETLVLLHLGTILVAMILDGTLGVRRDAIRVTRHHDQRIAVGVRTLIRTRIENRSPRRMALLVRDGIPGGLFPDTVVHHLTLEPGAVGCCETLIAPLRRGVFAMEHVWVRLPGILGLVGRILQCDVRSEISVIPDVRPLRAYDIKARILLSSAPGFRRLRRAGEGGEVARLREYRPGDDPRRIDWKATARHLSPITREMEAERNRNIVFVIDAGRWMGQPVGDLLKVDHAINAVLLAGHVAERHGDLTGVQVFSDRILTFQAPGRGRRHRLETLERLHRAPVEPVEPDFDEAFRHLALNLRKRSMVILFSDFSDPVTARSLLRSLTIVSRRHLVLCVHILDPGVEDHVGRRPETLQDLARRAIAEELHRERKHVLDHLRFRGVHVLECRADALTAELVNRYLDIKQRVLL